MSASVTPVNAAVDAHNSLPPPTYNPQKQDMFVGHPQIQQPPMYYPQMQQMPMNHPQMQPAFYPNGMYGNQYPMVINQQPQQQATVFVMQQQQATVVEKDNDLACICGCIAAWLCCLCGGPCFFL